MSSNKENIKEELLNKLIAKNKIKLSNNDKDLKSDKAHLKINSKVESKFRNNYKNYQYDYEEDFYEPKY